MRLVVHAVAPFRCPLVLSELLLDVFRCDVQREGALVNYERIFAVWNKLRARQCKGACGEFEHGGCMG